MIPYSRQKISSNDIKAVNKVLKSKFLTTGPKVIEFENKLSRVFKSKYALSVNSATSALHLACLSFGLKQNDYVWTSSISFVASANCALYCGAKVDFVDIDPDTLNMSIKDLERKLVIAKKNRKLPKIIIPVHLGGNACDMKSIYKLSKKYKFKILEDASHAVGSYYNGKPVGSCEYSDACIFSFHPVKIITTAEGGAILTNNKDIFKKISSLRNHGIERIRLKKKKTFDWYYEQQNLGFNYRLSDIQCALGISQLNNLNLIIKRRNYLVKQYKKYLYLDNLKIQKIDEKCSSSFHLFIIMTTYKDRIKIFKKLKSIGVTTSFHYIPIYRHPYYVRKKFNIKQYRNSEKYYKEGMSIPLFYDLSIKQIKKISQQINKIIVSK